MRGPDGGFSLARSSAEISLLDIFEAVDGHVLSVDPSVQSADGFQAKLRSCFDDAACAMKQKLAEVSIASLLQLDDSGQSWNSMSQ